MCLFISAMCMVEAQNISQKTTNGRCAAKYLIKNAVANAGVIQKEILRTFELWDFFCLFGMME